MRIAVFGIGLLGGSFCRALRSCVDGVRITAYDIDNEILFKAKHEGIVDEVLDRDDIDLEADAVFIALPVIRSTDMILRVLDRTGPQTLVVDMGSVKRGVIDAVIGHADAGRFVPCHPMAGSEQSGYEWSRGDLFRNAWVIVTPHEKNSDEMIARAKSLWETIGCTAFIADALAHDMIVAMTSHMPHLVSCAIARAAIEGTDFNAGIVPFLGPGIIDMTRLAGGSPMIWSEICAMNTHNITGALDLIIGILTDARNALSSGDSRMMIEQYLEKSIQSRKEIEYAQNSGRC
jgi:prephenate dehydrogenase